MSLRLRFRLECVMRLNGFQMVGVGKWGRDMLQAHSVRCRRLSLGQSGEGMLSWHVVCRRRSGT